MKTDLWVIWIALCAAFLFAGLAIGPFFPARHLLDRAYQDGWDDGFDRGFPHGLRAEGTDPGELSDLAASRGVLPWDDTAGHLEELAQPYYEPLARGAGVSSDAIPPVTTAPCASADIPLKGDSPGPGLPPLPIYDDLAAHWLANHPEFSPETSAPIGSPPVGAEPEPPIDGEVMPHEPQDREPVAHMNTPAPVLAPANNLHDPGAGADPWQQITAPLDDDPELNEWSIRAERARCHEIRRELHELGKALSKPFDLTPWKGATA